MASPIRTVRVRCIFILIRHCQGRNGGLIRVVWDYEFGTACRDLDTLIVVVE